MKEAKSLLYLLTLQCHYLCEDFPDTLAEHFEPLIETLRVTQKEQVYVLEWVYQGTDQSLTIDQSRFHCYVRGDLGKERPSNLQEKNEEESKKVLLEIGKQSGFYPCLQKSTL